MSIIVATQNCTDAQKQNHHTIPFWVKHVVQNAEKELKAREGKEKETYLDIPFYYHTLQTLQIVHCFHRIHMPFHIVLPDI